MASPFPGMNPYLEQPEIWRDFHDSFIPALRDAITLQVRPHFTVRIQESIDIHQPDEAERVRIGVGDVSLHRTGADDSPRERQASPIGVLDPSLEIFLAVDEEPQVS